MRYNKYLKFTTKQYKRENCKYNNENIDIIINRKYRKH